MSTVNGEKACRTKMKGGTSLRYIKKDQLYSDAGSIARRNPNQNSTLSDPQKMRILHNVPFPYDKPSVTLKHKDNADGFMRR
jgi:hypothetical protein